MKNIYTFILITICCGLNISFAQNTPILINYQGRLLDNLNSAINGNVTITFALYDSIVSGNQVWTETQTNLQSTNGIISTFLGIVTPFNTSHFLSKNLFLELNVQGYGILQPRQQFGSVPYAVNAVNSYRLMSSYIGDINITGTSDVVYYDTTFAPNTFSEYCRIEIEAACEGNGYFYFQPYFGPTGSELPLKRIDFGKYVNKDGATEILNPQAFWNVIINKNDIGKSLRFYIKKFESIGHIYSIYIWGK